MKKTRILITLLCLLSVSLLTYADDYQFTISTSDFNSTSYAANNNEKTSTAICTSDNTKSMDVKWTSNQVMYQNSGIQWQKNNGYIYNSTDLGTIKSVVITSSAGSFTTYYGTSEQPSSSTTVGNGFFKIVVGDATGNASSIVITFTPGSSSSLTDPTITFNNGSVQMGNTLDLSTLFSSNSDGSVTYSVVSGGTGSGTISGSTFTPSAVGTVNVKATQVSTATYNAGEQTAVITVTAAGDYATLPFSFNSGLSAISNTSGLSQDGIDSSDYSTTNTKLKFNSTGDYLILRINETPGVLTFYIKGNGFSGGTFKVQESANGSSWTDVATYTTDITASEVQKTISTLASSTRYIKWLFYNKSTGNVGLGNINLQKPTITPTIVTVNTFAEMKTLESGTDVFLKLAESNAGVIEYVDPVANAGTTSAQNAYVRDGSGAMKFSNVLPTSRAWHTRASGALIGNILGRYTVVNGMPTFTSVEGSTAHRMLCLEGYQAITPSNVSVSDLTGATYRADYVGLSEVTLTKSNDTYYVTDGNNNVLVDNAFSAVTLPETVASKRFDITGIVETTAGGDSKLSLLDIKEVFSSLTLNENYSNSTVIANHDNETVNIHLTRALTPNTWNTISLPISINEVSDVLGADVQIAEFTGYNSSSNVMEFTTVNEIEAGKPYLIYPTGETNSELVVNGIVISSNLVPVTHGNITFEPIFDPTELTGGDKTKLFLGAGNTLYYPSVTASLKAFRAYFSISTGQQTAPRFVVDGNLTDIQALTDDASEAGQQLYDLGGRAVSKKQQALPKGVYVKEGEKMIIK